MAKTKEQKELMADYAIKSLWEKQRNKSLSNLMLLFDEFQIVKEFEEKDRSAFRKQLIEDIMKTIGCCKRTAYDYILAMESIYSVMGIGDAKKVIIGGKRK